MTVDLPLQRVSGGFEIDVESMQETSSNFVKMGFFGKFFLKAFLNQLLSVVDNLSIISHMFIFNLNYPVNLLDFFKGLFPLITFDSIPTDEIYEYVFEFSEVDDEPLSEEFEAVGYESRLTLINMGSLFLVNFLVLPLFLLIALLVFYWFKLCTPGNRITRYLFKKAKGQVDEFFFNGIIMTIDASLLVTTIIALI